MTIHPKALPRPYLVERHDAQAIEQSDWTTGVLLTRRPDQEVVPEVLFLSWDNAPGEIGKAIRDHYAQHGNTAFLWRHPLELADITVAYKEPPQIQWKNRSQINARVALEVATAHE